MEKQSDNSEDETQIIDKIQREFEEFLEKKYEMSPQKTQKLIKEVLALNPSMKLKQVQDQPDAFKLNEGQTHEIKIAIEKSLGVELKKDQLQSMFEEGVEHMTNTVNNIIKKKYLDPMVNASKKIEEKAKSSLSGVPLGDCIKIEYNEEGEMIGFLLRPKLANLVFLKEKTDTHVLSQMLKVVIYLNRLLLKGQNLISKKRRKAVIVDKPKADELRR